LTPIVRGGQRRRAELRSALGSYDGIGDSHFQVWQGRVTLVVPLP
jgi:hypothetical protein